MPAVPLYGSVFEQGSSRVVGIFIFSPGGLGVSLFVVHTLILIASVVT